MPTAHKCKCKFYMLIESRHTKVKLNITIDWKIIKIDIWNKTLFPFKVLQQYKYVFIWLINQISVPQNTFLTWYKINWGKSKQMRHDSFYNKKTMINFISNFAALKIIRYNKWSTSTYFHVTSELFWLIVLTDDILIVFAS